MARKHTPEEIVSKLRQGEQPVHRRRGRRSSALRGAALREVSAGTTVWWEEGELHESRTETGLTAIVIEAESLDPAIRAALGTEPPTS
jgi:hypothetical protein